MTRPIIGITSEMLNIGLEFQASYNVNILNEDYKKLVEDRGAIPIILPVVTNMDLIDYYVDMCDGFLFTGGADINPLVYGELPNHNLGSTDLERDEFEIGLMKKIIDVDKPVLSICRGMQILNIARGGNLIQHIPDDLDYFNHMSNGNKYDLAHSVKFEKGNLFYNLFRDEIHVNSSHHQGLKDLGQGIEVMGRAEDGMIEAVGLKDSKFNYGVQWHPEELIYKDKNMNLLVDSFLDSCR